MVTARPMSFTEWKASGYQTTGPLPADAQMTPVAPPPAPEYSGEYVPVSTFTPNEVQPDQYYAPAYYPEQTAPAPAQDFGPPTNFGYGPPTVEQTNAAISQVAPPTSFGYGPNAEGYIAQDMNDRYLTGVATDAERERLARAAPVGSLSPTSDAYLDNQAAQEVERQKRDTTTPWQEKLIPGAVRDSGIANMGGTLKDAGGVVKDTLGQVGPIGAAGQGLQTVASGAIQAAQIPSQRVNEVMITRRYDEITKGNPDATFGPWLPTTMLGTALINPADRALDAITNYTPGETNALEPWLNDPANEKLIQTLFEQGYGGEQGYGAVFKYWDEQQGMGSVLSSVVRDPFTYASLGVGAGRSLATRLATEGGTIGAAGRVLGTGIEIADAAVLDPFKAPGLAIKGLDAVAPGLRVGERVAGAGTRIAEMPLNPLSLTAAGKAQRTLNQMEQNAAVLDSALAAAPAPQPWLFERDASNRIRLQSGPGGTVRPLVRDLATGAVRPVQAGDVEQAMQIAARLPHERAVRTAGGRTSYQRMMDDWMALENNTSMTGLTRELETIYPSRAAEYRRFTEMQARRVHRFGQEAIDAQYAVMRNKAASAMPEWDRVAREITTYTADLKARSTQVQNGLYALRQIPAGSRTAADKAEIKRLTAEAAAIANERRNGLPTALAADQKKAAISLAAVARQADRIEAAMTIAGRTDASAKVRKAEIARIRKAARSTGRYTKDDTYKAMVASGAKAPRGGVPARLTWNDLTDVVDDETRAFASQTLADGRLVGDVVLGVRQDLARVRDLAEQFTQGPLSPWDQQELERLLTQYQHLLPNAKNAFTAARLPETIQSVAGWKDQTFSILTAEEARRQLGIDAGLLDSNGRVIPTGAAARNDVIGKLVRGLDVVGSQYRKFQLYNPLNILRYTGLQAIGNAVLIGLTDAGALQDYAKAIGSRIKSRGRTDALTPADQMLREAGIGSSPFIKQGIKDDLLNIADGNGPVERVLLAGRKFAGAFDLSLREAAYMHRFQPRYRALQMHMRDEAIRRAASMGVPINTAQLDAAFGALDQLHPRFRAWNPSELKDALLNAGGAPKNALTENWADRVARDYANGIKQVHKDGIANVNRLGFSFEETKADALLGKLFMYHYWSSRANMLYTREMLGNPALLNGYVSLWKTLDREGEKDNAPPWLRGFYAFMQTPMGLTVFGNPTALLNTFAIFNPDILGEGYDGNLTGLGKARQRSPFAINPVIDTLLYAAGLYGSAANDPQVMPISGAKLYDWLTYWNSHSDTPFWTDAKGNPVPPPMSLRTFGGRDVARIVAETVSPHTKAIFDRMGIPADVMQFGDMASSQQQDITFLMMTILQEQNPAADQNTILDILVSDHGGGLDTGDPIYQQALDRYADRAFAGILEGRDVPNAVRGLIDAAQPFGRITQVTERLQNDATVNGYFQADEDQNTWREIADGTYEGDVRIGGFEVAPPSLFTTIDMGGTVYTAEDVQVLTPEERKIVADAWFNERNPGYTAGEAMAFPESALRASDIARAADPQDLANQEAEDAFYHPGSPDQNEAATFAKSIRDGKIADDGSVTVTVDGAARTFDNNDLARMTETERRALASLWAAESGNQESIDGYYAARDQVVTDNPDIGGLFAMKDLAASYPGGAIEWVEDAIKENPETYGQFAERLDETRYPRGTEDWAKKMLSLEGYQALTQQRPASSSPLLWETTPGAPVIPGMSGAASLPDLYLQNQASEDADAKKTPSQIVTDDLGRVSDGLALADQYDAEMGYAPGTSRGKIIDQIIKGDYDDSNKIDKALLDQLNDQFGAVGKDGETYGFIPKGESYTRKYIVWALRQPEGERDPGLWSAQDWLAGEFEKAAEQGLVEDAQGNLVLDERKPETTTGAADFLNGLGLTRAADGSGEMLTTSPRQSTAAQPSYTVGGMGGTLYQDASTNSQPIIILGPDTPLTTIEQSGEWLHVVEPGGLEGWMRKGYLSSGQRTPAPVSEPVTPTLAPATNGLPASVPLPVPPSQRPGGIVPTPTTPTTRAPATPAPILAPTPAPAPNMAESDLASTFSQQQRLLAPEMPAEPGAYDPRVIQNIDTTTYVSPSRSTRPAPPQGIVYHYTVGDLDSFVADFMGQTGRQASANYVVDRDGTIYQFVDPDDAAWTHGDTNNPRTDLPWLTEQMASGNTDMNMSAIGIEIVNAGNASNPGSQNPADFEPYTPQQIAALEQLTNYLVQRYGIPPTRDHLLGHSDINQADKQDPGPLFPWQQILAAAGG